MRSYLDFEGVYDKTKRYMVHNWSDEEFTQHFGAETVYNDTKVIETQPAYSLTIRAGEMRELGQFEAYTFTRHFVDREMYRAAAQFTDRALRERAEMGINNPDQRKVYEEKTIREIGVGTAIPFMDKLREEIRAEELAKLQNVQPAETVEVQVVDLPQKPEKVEKVEKETKADKRTREYKEALRAKAKEINETIERQKANEFSE